MGFATRDELVPALNELLDAERAGASVTLQTAKEAPEPLKSVVMSMQRDEARWRGAPTKAIQQLHGRPSPKTGAFYGKAMTIPDMTARLTFLYRGQGWVVRKLEALLPTVRDEALHAELTEMLKSHRDNIELVEAHSPEPGTVGDTP